MSIMQSEEKGFFHTANAFTLNKALRNGGYDRLHPDDKKVARLAPFTGVFQYKLKFT